MRKHKGTAGKWQSSYFILFRSSVSNMLLVMNNNFVVISNKLSRKLKLYKKKCVLRFIVFMIINDFPCPKWKLSLEILTNTIMLGKAIKLCSFYLYHLLTFYFLCFVICTIHQCQKITTYISWECA